MRAAPAGEGGLLLVEGAAPRSEGCEGSLSRCRGDRPLQSSRPLEAAAVAELQVALAFRGCKTNRGGLSYRAYAHAPRECAHRCIHVCVSVLVLPTWRACFSWSCSHCR